MPNDRSQYVGRSRMGEASRHLYHGVLQALHNNACVITLLCTCLIGSFTLGNLRQAGCCVFFARSGF